MKILITGIAGTIGTVLARRLSRDHEVTGIDLRESAEFETAMVDLNDYEATLQQLDGVEAVIHLAAERRHGREVGWDLLMPRNVQPTANVFQAAHEVGVRRLVFASSMHVMGLYEEDEPWASIVAGRYDGLDSDNVPLVTTDMPVRPDGRYAVTKAFGEHLARYYAEAEGMESIAVRLGTTSDNDRPGSDPRSFVSWFSHRDIGNFFATCVEKPNLKYEIVYGTSANTWKVYDTPRSWEVLGF